LVVLLLGAATVCALLRMQSTSVSQSQSAASSRESRYYWRHSMWLVDAKTCAHALAYILRPETLPRTNAVVNG